MYVDRDNNLIKINLSKSLNITLSHLKGGSCRMLCFYQSKRSNVLDKERRELFLSSGGGGEVGDERQTYYLMVGVEIQNKGANGIGIMGIGGMSSYNVTVLCHLYGLIKIFN